MNKNELEIRLEELYQKAAFILGIIADVEVEARMISLDSERKIRVADALRLVQKHARELDLDTRALKGELYGNDR